MCYLSFWVILLKKFCSNYCICDIKICGLFRLQLYDLVELKVLGDGNCQVGPPQPKTNLSAYILMLGNGNNRFYAIVQ